MQTRVQAHQCGEPGQTEREEGCRVGLAIDVQGSTNAKRSQSADHFSEDVRSIKKEKKAHLAIDAKVGAEANRSYVLIHFSKSLRL